MSYSAMFLPNIDTFYEQNCISNYVQKNRNSSHVNIKNNTCFYCNVQLY